MKITMSIYSLSMRMLPTIGVTAALLSGPAPMPCPAQADRLELGRRLRGFEEHWDRTADPEARRRAAETLEESVGAFFRMDFGSAARAMTRARNLLDRPTPPPPSVQWAEALTIAPDTRLIERGRPTLGVTLSAVYPIDGGAPANPRALIAVVIAGESAPRPLLDVPLETLPMTAALPTEGLPEGDHTLRLRITVGREAVAGTETMLSVLDRMKDRIATARDAIEAMDDTNASKATDLGTARQHAQLLSNLSAGTTPEAEIPAAELMAELEQLIESLGAGHPYHGASRAGSHRIALATNGGRSVPARVFVPEGIGESAVPLVVALHGMGGSENLFFEGYGRGAIVRLCKDRGWLLVSPRRGPIGAGPVVEVVEAMASLYPVDRSRVFLVGHSMGAMQSIDALSRGPDRYAGVAALGGGGRLADRPGIERVPVFIGIGERDFLLRSARELRDSLAVIGSDRVDYREYRDIEHLVIVQVALPDAFAFFDGIAAADRP